MENSLVSITGSGDRLMVASPYNASFVRRARTLGGKFVDRVWTFDARDEARVRALCHEVYGTDGVESDLCTVRVMFECGLARLCAPIAIGGRTVARATGRDSGATLGDDVVVLEGGFTSGGSYKNWKTLVLDGTSVLIRNFPRQVALKKIAAGETGISIEDEGAMVDREALTAEKIRLDARIAEIDRLLQAGCV